MQRIGQDTVIPLLLQKHEASLLRDWLTTQSRDRGSGSNAVGARDLERQSRDFLSAFQASSQSGDFGDLQTEAWEKTRDVLADISLAQSRSGATPTEVATFIFSLKEPLFALLQKELGDNTARLSTEILSASLALDKLGLFTTSSAFKAREEVIARQQAEMLELSTPVVKLRDGILALPLIGTLDSERTQVVMENLLQEIVTTGAGIAIIDITGVPTVDTLVAQHLLKTVAAARLMGAECIISGIRPQIASTIVHLGVDLGDVVTKATLADAFSVALRRTSRTVVTVQPRKEMSE